MPSPESASCILKKCPCSASMRFSITKRQWRKFRSPHRRSGKWSACPEPRRAHPMILDKRTEFADAVSVAATAGTALIGSQIDLTTARDIGNGRPVYLIITTDTEIITGGSAGTIQFKLASDATAAVR